MPKILSLRLPPKDLGTGDRYCAGKASVLISDFLHLNDSTYSEKLMAYCTEVSVLV